MVKRGLIKMIKKRKGVYYMTPLQRLDLAGRDLTPVRQL